MREIFFDENSIDNGLRQAYKKIIKEGFDSYIVLAVGNGGEQIAKRLEKYWNYKDIVSCVLKNGDIHILDDSKIKGNRIFVCDDTTITGKTFTNLFKKLSELGADDIKLLSLLMRRDSSVVPNIFIFEIEADTKVYFPWSDYPIRTYSKGIIRKISCEDCIKDFKCGDQKIDKNSLSDFFKNQQHSSAKVYLVEDRGEICSIVQFYEKHLDSHKGLFLDIIATAECKKGNKYASTLLKLISYYMFYHEFSFIYGYAFDNEELIDMYKRRGFEVIGSIQDPHYGTLHKIVIINGTKDMKDHVIAAIRPHV
ncbi:hypothetical protein ANME2D_03077 [Candidatus Methanoperedens nitroreducens]|uniref:N-acetyltransferase domain-containing protein n=1 Tax=Candidatus Methanoperedens nitratireducens TaxID=1392998 RepID=A0A062V0Z0_9EURY|nr:phosphoribosyltransferase [Candidatus Methanoperedens nitroreducens]KCZ71047.1 hypothetical protein ANME2D_03077 [Candidatus Methanoperedens nitroreducens]MDJ1421578.1 phosphoribosyltransferase [Candidatus Methanoperedens sp.]